MNTAAALLPRRRRGTAAVAALLALLVTLLVPTAARADAGAEASFVQLVNQERAARGLAPLAVADDLVAVARRHSGRMADADDLHHNPSLATEVSDWQKVGENVGRGPSVDPIHTAFMESPGHRANILDGDWTQIGIGVVVRDGTVWVTEVFREPLAATAPAPAPAPEPAPHRPRHPPPSPSRPPLPPRPPRPRRPRPRPPRSRTGARAHAGCPGRRPGARDADAGGRRGRRAGRRLTNWSVHGAPAGTWLRSAPCPR